MKFLRQNKTGLNTKVFSESDFVVLSDEQLLNVNGAGGTGSSTPSGPTTSVTNTSSNSKQSTSENLSDRGYPSTKDGNTYVSPIPTYPDGVDINKNIEEAKKMGPTAFYNAVRNGGKWDYKQQGSEYKDFGNFNYGVTGTAAGCSEQVLKRAAGWAQEQAGTSMDEWGHWYGGAPYGDDPADQVQIQKGIDYYNERYK